MIRIAAFRRVVGAGIALALGAAVGHGAEVSAAQLQEVLEQNRRLQEQVRAQQKTIDDLNAKVNDVVKASERHERDLRRLEGQPGGAAPASAGARDHQVRIAAEAGLAFFKTGSEGQFPKGEFRVDDPVITLEAPVMKDVYLFTELKLLTRETNVEDFQLGELYVEFEDVLGRWGRPGLLSFRAGRVNVPFGEEYLVRSPVTNPLISHSLSDIWGCDEGLEIYGRVGPLRYVLAVQNGGASRLRDFNADKSIAARVSWEPAAWLHVSASAMRTGELASIADNVSEIWFANGFFRAIGPIARTGAFWANLYEGDARVRWKTGHLSLALGQARYDDSDKLADNARRIRYGFIEAVQSLAAGWYGAARYSELRAGRGYPLAGWGPLGTFFFRPSLTEELHRLSVGLGYRFGPPLVWKIEYARERGRMTNGVRRENEDFFGSEIGMKF
ncbi:MAG TPA: hypothetical protein VM029_06765 [Opitutaceae bacterium]|nr:hypothetical protein [Opitutaceae bacterium]